MHWRSLILKAFATIAFSAGTVSMDDDSWKSVKPFLQQHKINYPIVIGNSEMGDRFGFNSMPATLLIDRNGKIARKFIGFQQWDSPEMLAYFDALLGQT